MPELPEVETIKNDLVRAGLCARAIRSADIFWHRTLAIPSAAELNKKIKNIKIENLSRRGKYLILELASREKWFLIMHLRMSGRIDLKEAGFAPRTHDRARLVLDDGSQLLFHDTRKFGRWYFVNDAEKIVGKLGMEPLDKKFTGEWLSKKIKGKSRTLKPLLLDQSFVAGIGNIYADEALWYAKLHPETNSARLKPAEVQALHEGIVKAIELGIRNAGTSMGVGKANFYSVGGKRGGNQEKLKVFRRTGEGCPRCHAKIVRIVVGQRSTHLCPNCQKRRK
ncbi:MAG TPA: bifunctional DNA-formamidopyrimidine glycosylase/DNA-(apurinic or apyrimidinic site) lyase [Candidatus Omnitrophota bacterium]|mgnify:CR=1 FL=1|nr:bifunctional DNA-formamidopyrimidine glycosylase/DNA-(apurinic or apyrimidinic site) lyase [Candidatus Omnitrophota bacterium]